MQISFDAEDKTLDKIICDKERYKIPRYQRPYSWTKDEVSDLWNDLRDDEASFLGTFVFNYENFERNGIIEVIDGQQRLITLTILIAVIRDYYKELGDFKKADLTQISVIEFRDNITGDPTFRLKCSDSLDKFFCKNIQQTDSDIFNSSPKRREEKAVKENYIFLKEQIQKEIEGREDNLKKIEYLDSLKKRIFDLKVIWVKIEKDDDAYSIFETVNARGADLTAADLLKNHLFQRIPKTEEGIDLAKELWADVENNIESAKGPLTVSKFIRYYWLSRYSFVPEKRLYKEIKKNIDDPRSFLQEIDCVSRIYNKMVNDTISPEAWMDEFGDKKISQKVYESLYSLRIMGITQCYPLLFCLISNREKIGFDFSDVFKTIEKHHFAYSAVCKLSGNVVERVYFNTAKEIQESFKLNGEKRIKSIQRSLSMFKNKLKDVYPTKDLFIEKFCEIEYKNRSIVNYILSNIEKSKKKTSEHNINFSKVNIEHILPQDPTEWNLSKKDVKDYVNNIGNLTLIDKKINGAIGRGSLKKKAKLFKNSELSINKELMQKFKQTDFKWKEDDIRDRARKIAEEAYDNVWKIN